MILLRTMQARKCTIGFLEYGEFWCFTLELPWRMNEEKRSCIPGGTYTYRKHESMKNGKCLQLDDVPRRSFIQIHAGNYTREIQGCILPGTKLVDLNLDRLPDVADSRVALGELLSVVPDEGEIMIIRYGI